MTIALVSVREVLSLIGGRVVNGEGQEIKLNTLQVAKPAPLKQSLQTDIAFFFSKIFENELIHANPGILVTAESFVRYLESLPIWKTSIIISCPDPYWALGVLSEKFAAQLSTVAHLLPSEKKTEVHATAWVAKTVELGEGVTVGPYCVIEDGAYLGRGTFLYSHCFVGPRCTVGQDCVLFSHVVLYEWTILGNRVRIHSHSVIGADGFGYAPKREGKRILGHQKIYHLGRVVVGDDVEVGANSCIDRGTLADTQIQNKVKIDNQVHIGHNAKVDEGSILCGGTSLAGNASVGKYVYVGGMVGIDNHVHVGDGAKVCGTTLVTKDVLPGKVVAGNPQRDHKEHFRVHAMLTKLLEQRRGKK